MGIHVTRKDGTVAGYRDDQRAQAEAYAADVDGELTDVSDSDESQTPAEQPEEPLD